MAIEPSSATGCAWPTAGRPILIRLATPGRLPKLLAVRLRREARGGPEGRWLEPRCWVLAVGAVEPPWLAWTGQVPEAGQRPTVDDGDHPADYAARRDAAGAG